MVEDGPELSFAFEPRVGLCFWELRVDARSFEHYYALEPLVVDPIDFAEAPHVETVLNDVVPKILKFRELGSILGLRERRPHDAGKTSFVFKQRGEPLRVV